VSRTGAAVLACRARRSTALAVALVLSLSPLACRKELPAGRYLVTATPIDLGVGSRHPGLCVAIDPMDAEGVWWWEPGHEGCATRTSGPGVFRPQRVTVTRAESGAIAAKFALQPLLVGPRELTLSIRDGEFHVAGSEVRIAVDGRNDLEIPLVAP
jgi:hypothetical protein